MTEQEKRDEIIKKLAILRAWMAVNPKYDKGLDAEDCVAAVPWLDEAIEALKAQEPRTCRECRHYDINAFIDMGGKCRNSRSCHYCYGCDKSFSCNAWEGR